MSNKRKNHKQTQRYTNVQWDMGLFCSFFWIYFVFVEKKLVSPCYCENQVSSS